MLAPPVRQCVAHTAAEDITVKYIVEWQDRDQSLFRVRIPPVELPSCRHPEVTQLTVQLIRSTLTGATLKSVDGHREFSYDSDAEIRHGECVAHKSKGLPFDQSRVLG